MPGEIASAFVAVVPSFRNFGSSLSAQMAPQMQAAARAGGAAATKEIAALVGSPQIKSAAAQVGTITSAAAVGARETAGWLGESAQMAVKNVALYGSMYGAIQLARAGVEAMFADMVGFNAQLEQAQIGFTTLLGSSSAAESEMSWIKDFAKETPFRYGDVVSYDERLIAMGFDARQAHEALTAAGDAAAALGSGDEGIARITLALGQMWTKGKVQSQEMLQLTEAGLGAWQILADKYNISVAELQDNVTNGLVPAAEAVPALIEGIEAQMGGLMSKQSQTFAGMWSNIQDTLQQDLADAGKPLFDELSADARKFLDSLNDPQVQRSLNALGQGLATSAQLLSGLVSWAWQGRDAFIALGVAMAGRALWQSTHVQGFIANVKAVGPALAETSAAQAAYAAATDASAVAQAKFTAASEVSTLAARDAKAMSAAFQAERARETASELELTVARDQANAAAVEAAVLERAMQTASAESVRALTAEAAAEERLQAARQARSAALGNFKGIGSALGSMVGLGVAVDGLNRVGEAADNTDAALGGFIEATGGGVAAGAAFGLALGPMGAAAGAAIGGVVGLTTAIVNYNQALANSDSDTSAAQSAIEQLGVTSSTAADLMSHLTNSQIEQLGGLKAITSAFGPNGTPEQIAAITQKIQEFAKVAADTESANLDPFRAMGLGVVADLYDAIGPLGKLRREWESTAAAVGTFSDAAAESHYQEFLNVEAMDALSGAYSETALAAWNAANAFGQIPLSLESTGVAAEGASGKVGYLLSAITGLPVNTAINFSSNAAVIFQQIVALQEAIASLGTGSQGQAFSAGNWAKYASEQAQLAALQSKFSSALTTFDVTAATNDSSSGGGSAYDAAAAATDAAAKAAAQKLAQDQRAQLAFGDAFGSLMKQALSGNFDQFKDQLQSEITSLTRDGYDQAVSTLKRLDGSLTQVALDYSALTNKLKTTTSAYDDLTKAMSDQYQTSVDLVLGLGKVTDAASFDQLTYLLGETTTATSAYTDMLAQLKAEGLDEGLWKQLASAGPESSALVQSIIGQGQAGVDQLNSLYAGLESSADSFGDTVSAGMYQSGVDAMKAYMDGLSSQEAALESQLVTIANNVLNQTAAAITSGNQGYAAIVGGTTTTSNTYNITLNASDFDDLNKIQAWLASLDAASTTQVVNAAGTVTS